jgi:hypothetical protein
MRKVLLLLIVAVMSVPAVSAQEFDRINLGVYAESFRSNQNRNQHARTGRARGSEGVSASETGKRGVLRLQSGLCKRIYKYERRNSDVSEYRDADDAGVVWAEAGTGAERGQAVSGKGGFVNYSFDARRHQRSVDFGVEGWKGGSAVGLRLDVGDETYFNDGTHHNLKVMSGPFVRF